MSFLLDVVYRDDGYTGFTFDTGPASRTQFLAAPGMSSEILGIDPERLVGNGDGYVRGSEIRKRRP